MYTVVYSIVVRTKSLTIVFPLHRTLQNSTDSVCFVLYMHSSFWFKVGRALLENQDITCSCAPIRFSPEFDSKYDDSGFDLLASPDADVYFLSNQANQSPDFWTVYK